MSESVIKGAILAVSIIDQTLILMRWLAFLGMAIIAQANKKGSKRYTRHQRDVSRRMYLCIGKQNIAALLRNCVQKKRICAIMDGACLQKRFWRSVRWVILY